MNALTIDFPSDPLFQAFGYPGGERQARLTDAGLKSVVLADTIKIRARVRSTAAVIDLLQLLDAIYGVNHKAFIYLSMPYLPYARADRRFTAGDCNGLKVFSNLLQSSGLIHQIQVLDVHNEEAAKTFFGDKFVNVQPTYLIRECMAHFAAAANVPHASELTVLFPDKGAKDRYRSVDARRELYATKKREGATGKLLGFECGFDFRSDESVLIIDDICDGGGTFLGIAETLKKEGFVGNLGLYVTHGIFSKGTKELQKNFDRIYCTDSFSKPSEPNGVEYYSVWNWMP